MRARGKGRVDRPGENARVVADVQAHHHRAHSLVKVDRRRPAAVDPTLLKIPTPVAVSNVEEIGNDRPIPPAQRIAATILEEERVVPAAIKLMAVPVDVSVAGASQ